MEARPVAAALMWSQVAINMLALTQVVEPSMFAPSTILTNGIIYDYIVIGGGTAGSVVATRLAEENKFKVLLIEAGEDPIYETKFPSLVPYIRNTRVDWNYTSENDGYTQQCHVNKVLDLGLGKMLGGTSELNYMIYSRGNVLDYDHWCHITNDTTWKWTNVLPYYIKSENLSDPEIMKSSHKVYHGTKGPMHVMKDQNSVTKEYLQAFKEAGHEIILHADGCKLGYSPALITVNAGLRQGSADAYLTRVKNNPYLTIAKNSLATKIIFDDHKNAVAIEVINNMDEKVVVDATKEIIVTAGAIKSPQILMLSGIGPKAHLEKMNITVLVDSPEVGKNYQDHTAVITVHKTSKLTQPKSCDPGLYPSPLFVGFVALSKSSQYPAYQAMDFITDPLFLLQLCLSAFKFNNDICQKWYNKTKNNEVLVSLISNMYTKSRGQITLRSANPKVQPKIITGTFSADNDLDAMVDYLADYLKVEETDYFKKINATMINPIRKCNKFKRGSRKYWRCYTLCITSSMGHYGGTCAMGTVVDGQLRVRGVQRLRVADASVMPLLVSGNTQSPVIMIAEKVSQFLIQDGECLLHSK